MLERYGSAIRFHPRLLELAGHYHFAPRPCAPARGNEKGRVERQIQYLRRSFFAARIFRTQEVASHERSFETKKVVEEPAHVEALVRAKKNASALKARDRLRIAVPKCTTLIEKLAERGESLGHHTARLLKLLDEYGPEELSIAIDCALERDALGSGSITRILETRHRQKGLRPPLSMFPNASCAVALNDRLTHHAEIISLQGESYRGRHTDNAARAAQPSS